MRTGRASAGTAERGAKNRASRGLRGKPLSREKMKSEENAPIPRILHTKGRSLLIILVKDAVDAAEVRTAATRLRREENEKRGGVEGTGGKRTEED